MLHGSIVHELGKIWKKAAVAAEIRTDYLKNGSLKSLDRCNNALCPVRTVIRWPKTD
jgi:hypothetical protein